MMNKKQTSKLSIFKYTLLIPVVGALVFFNSTLKLQAGTVKTTEIVKMVETIKKTLIDETVKVNEPVEPQKPVVQDITPQTVVQDIAPQTQDKKKEVYSHVEVMPQFPGGAQEMMVFLRDNIQYPVTAAEQHIEGRVIVRFVVGSDGTVGDVEIVRSLDPSCDKEAIRVIRKMPTWVPGKQNGEAVSVYYLLPIIFRLQGNDADAKEPDNPDAATDTSENKNALDEVTVTGYAIEKEDASEATAVSPTM